MRCKLVKLSRFSGNKASIYSIVLNDEQETLLDKFIHDNKNTFLSEIKDILERLRTIGKKTGARIDYFKLFEGTPGDGVCALYDDEDSNLRLYCIRYGSQLVIAGNGGPKPKSIQALQEDEKLTDENYFLRWLSDEITTRIKEREICYINDFLDFSGNLEFQDDETNQLI
jgi:hypothetical protein